MALNLMAAVMDRGPQDLAEAMVLLSICDSADRDSGEAWPSQATIARRARLTDRGVRAVLERLRAAGWLTWEARTRPNGSRTTNVYTVNLAMLGEGPRSGPEPGQGRDGATGARNHVPGVPGTTFRGCPEPRSGEARNHVPGRARNHVPGQNLIRKNLRARDAAGDNPDAVRAATGAPVPGEVEPVATGASVPGEVEPVATGASVPGEVERVATGATVPGEVEPVATGATGPGSWADDGRGVFNAKAAAAKRLGLRYRDAAGEWCEPGAARRAA